VVGGGCEHPDHTHAVETKRRVTIAAYDVVYVPGPHGACAADITLTRLTIILRRPLANRGLVHAPITPGYGN
jgi:hypothetical protein